MYKVCIRCYTYNHGEFIEDALKGFVAQETDFPFVTVIVDDASTDCAPQILKSFFEANFEFNDSKTAYQEETPYGSVLFARHLTNRNCYFAIVLLKENHFSIGKPKMPYMSQWINSSEYIAICEGDDYWTDPFKMQKQVGILDENSDYGLCYTDFDMLDQSKHKIKKAVFENGIYKRPASFEEHLVECGFIAPLSWMYRRTVHEKLEYKTFTDGTFSLALAFFKQSRVFYLPEVTCVYRAHMGSMSRPVSGIGHFVQYKGVFDTQLYFAEKYEVGEKLTKFIKSGGYIKLLPLAIETKQNEFINEASAFFNENSFCFDELFKLSSFYDQARRDSLKARKSYAYRVGKAILKPFSFVKRMLLR